MNLKEQKAFFEKEVAREKSYGHGWRTAEALAGLALGAEMRKRAGGKPGETKKGENKNENRLRKLGQDDSG